MTVIAIYEYSNGIKFIGVATNREIAIQKLYNKYASKSYEDYGDHAIEYWWKSCGKCFHLEKTKIWE